jgi:hypothetical protein
MKALIAFFEIIAELLKILLLLIAGLAILSIPIMLLRALIFGDSDM